MVTLLKYLKSPQFLLTLGVAASLGLSSCATAPSDPTGQSGIRNAPMANTNADVQTFDENELVTAVSTHLGVTSESAASMIERLFRKQGRPVGYITGQEGSGAVGVGFRYGNGVLWMKDGRSQKVYWRGPSLGWDWGGNASKVFTLVYDLKDPDYIFRRFPGVDGSAYLVAGMGVNYQRADGITLAPIRTGVGARLGANVGYLSYKRKKGLWPF